MVGYGHTHRERERIDTQFFEVSEQFGIKIRLYWNISTFSNSSKECKKQMKSSPEIIKEGIYYKDLAYKC